MSRLGICLNFYFFKEAATLFTCLTNFLVYFLRLLQHSGVYPDLTEEPSDLASGRANVKSVTLLISDWFESGVLHAKVWISDSRDVYIGSANNDWKSLTQVNCNFKFLISRKLEYAYACIFNVSIYR